MLMRLMGNGQRAKAELKKLIIVRHADYERRDGLYRISGRGRGQMESLSGKLGEVVNGSGSTRMLTSSAPRAVDSRDELQEHLGIADCDDPIELLWSDNRHRADYPAATEHIRERGEDVDVLVVVTHLEYGEHLPRRCATGGMSVPRRELRKGCAAVLDFETNTVSFVFP